MRTSRCNLVLAAALMLVPAIAFAQHENDHAHRRAREARQREFSDFVRARSPASFAARPGASALVRVRRGGEGVRRSRRRKTPRAGWRNGALAMSHYHTIWAPPTEAEFAAGRAAAAEKAAKLGAPSARERDYIARDRCLLPGRRRRAPARASWPTRRRWPASPSATRTTTRRRSSTRWRFSVWPTTRRPTRPTRGRRRRRRSSTACCAHAARASGHRALHDPLVRLSRRSRSSRCPPRAPTRRSRRRRRTRCTCRRTSSRGSACGRNRSSPTSPRPKTGAAMDREDPSRRDRVRCAARDGLPGVRVSAVGAGRESARVVETGRARWTASTSPRSPPATRSPRSPRATRSSIGTGRVLRRSPCSRRSFPWDKYAYAEAIIHFARGVGAARAGDVETAREAVARLTAIQTALQKQKGFDWATQVEIQRRAAAGWLARAEKQDDEALALMRSAADSRTARTSIPSPRARSCRRANSSPTCSRSWASPRRR